MYYVLQKTKIKSIKAMKVEKLFRYLSIFLLLSIFLNYVHYFLANEIHLFIYRKYWIFKIKQPLNSMLE